MRKAPVTAIELLAQRNGDPAWVKDNAARETHRENLRIRHAAEVEPLLAEFKTVGINITSLEALANRSERYTPAIPILLRHLSFPYSENVRALIASLLAVPEAACVHQGLVEALKREIEIQPERKIRGVVQALACAVAESTTPENIPFLIALIKDESLGDDRLLFLRRLKRSRRPDAVQVLSELATHPTFKREMQSWRRAQK